MRHHDSSGSFFFTRLSPSLARRTDAEENVAVKTWNGITLYAHIVHQDMKEHNRIGDLVQETVESAYAAAREASAVFERAKRRVEELIEREAA